MTYFEKYSKLKQLFNQGKELISLPGSDIEIRNINFHSDAQSLLPGNQIHSCEKHNIDFAENLLKRDDVLPDFYPEILGYDDFSIKENENFYYTIFRKAGIEKSKDAIFLFHGLNEKHWFKYLPWAEKLVELTGKAVILFPIAFHMNRAPKEWGEPRLMNKVAEIRNSNLYAVNNSTFANAAISARIQQIPQRFFWSGLQTFYDVVKLIKDIKSDDHPFIKNSAKIDLFAYSIGSFLSEILMMSNPFNLFNDSKLFIFCGGPTLDRMRPNSKYILDSDATIAIYSFYTEKLESELKHDSRVEHYFLKGHRSGSYFKSMLNYQKDKDLREKRFSELSKQIFAVGLKKDEVIPPYEILNTLKGDFRDIPIKVELLDYPFEYDHINPFPVKRDSKIDEEFAKLFDLAKDFYK